MIAWSRLLIDDYCSSWSIVQILGWLNHSRVAWLKTKRAWRFHLTDQSVLLPDTGTATCLAKQEELREVARMLADPRRWLPEDELRYCPVCIGFGMHYGHQQDRIFRNCFIHGRPLQERCPICGNALETKGVSCNGFVCLRCGKSLLPLPAPVLRDSRQIDSVVIALDELEGWQSHTEQLSAGYQQPGTGRAFPLWGSRSPNDRAAWNWRALDLNPNSRIAAAMEPAPVGFQLVPNVARVTRLLEAEFQRSADNTLQPYELLFRCVARHLRRSYLRGHGACWKYATAAMGGLGHGRSKQIYIQPDMCCLGQAYTLWRLQWSREFERMERWLARASEASTGSDFGLASLHAAQLCLISSFQHWVRALAEIQEAFCGSDQRAILDGVTDRPHWALLQREASYSCPIHFRHPSLRTLGRCDQGSVRRREHERVVSRLREIRSFRGPREGRGIAVVHPPI